MASQNRATTGHDIVVIGGSAGGIEALREITQRLPGDLQASVFVALHMPRGSRSVLPEILTRSGPLPAKHPRDREPIQRGKVYIAPPDHHLLLDDGHIRLTRGPQHNRHRPGIDPLFGSAARSYGSRVIGVVLSGTLDDGTAGLAKIKRAGGLAIVQDPKTAAYPGMTESALAHVDVDEVATLPELANAIVRSVGKPAPERARSSDPLLDEEFAGDLGERTDMEEIGKPSVYACPECHGALWEFDEDGVLQFRCRVGHSFSSEGLLTEHDGHLDASLWAALRALEENASLRRRLARRAKDRRMNHMAEQYERRAKDAEHHAATLRDLLLSESSPTATHGLES